MMRPLHEAWISGGVARRRQDGRALRFEPDCRRSGIFRSAKERVKQLRDRTKFSSFPRKSMRKSRTGLQILVIPAKAGISLRRLRKKNRADTDEVLSASYCLLPRRIPGRSDRHSESHPCKHSSFPRKRESPCGVSVRKTGPILTKSYQRVIVFCRAESLGAPTVIVRAILTNTRHSRESGNLFAALP